MHARVASRLLWQVLTSIDGEIVAKAEGTNMLVSCRGSFWYLDVWGVKEMRGVAVLELRFDMVVYLKTWVNFNWSCDLCVKTTRWQIWSTLGLKQLTWIYDQPIR